MTDIVSTGIRPWIEEDNSLWNVFVVATDKGGSGKTTVAREIAGALAYSGINSLAIVELDYQGSLAYSLGFPESWIRDEHGPPLDIPERAPRPVSLYEELTTGEQAQPYRLPAPDGATSERAVIDLFAGTANLDLFAGDEPPPYKQYLEDILTRLSGLYDVVIVDTRPEIQSPLVSAALAVAASVIVPYDNRDGAGTMYVKNTLRAIESRNTTRRRPIRVAGLIKFDRRGSTPKEREGLEQTRTAEAAELGVTSLGTVGMAPTMYSQVRDSRMFVHEYGEAIVRHLRDGKSTSWLRTRGFLVSAVGSELSRSAAEQYAGHDQVINGVLVDGGLAGDYRIIAAGVMKALMELAIEHDMIDEEVALEWAASFGMSPAESAAWFSATVSRNTNTLTEGDQS